MTANQNIFDEIQDKDTLGGRIGRAREITGMTQEEAAENLGVTLDTLGNWESDRVEPRANRLTMLAGFLNVSTSWLLHGVGESPASADYSKIVQELEEQLIAVEKSHAQAAQEIAVLKSMIQRLNQSEI